MPDRVSRVRAWARAAAIAAATGLCLVSPASADRAGGGHGGGGRGRQGQVMPFASPTGASPTAAGAALGDNDDVMRIEGELADARNRTIQLTAWIVGLGILQTLIFGLALIAAARAMKEARAAGRALAMLDRAYLFLDQDISLAHADHRGPRGGLKLRFAFGMKNHGRSPAVVRWLNIRQQYLPAQPEGRYEEAGSSEGLIVGAGETVRFDHHDTIIAGADWDKAEAGEGAIYLHGCLVYWDIFKEQHQTFFCWRYDSARHTFAIAESATLNRFD